MSGSRTLPSRGLLSFTLAWTLSAQLVGARAEDALPDPPAPPPPDPRALLVEPARPRALDRSYWIAAAGLAALSAYDVETTYKTLGRCLPPCHEGNGFLRGVIDSGRPWAYTYQAATNLTIGYVAHQAKKSRHPAIRKAWWVPFAIAGWGHLLGGTLNITSDRGQRTAAGRSPGPR